MNQAFKHKNRERLCYLCNELMGKKEDIREFVIAYRGYGSTFDGERCRFQFCSSCMKKHRIDPIWFDEVPIERDYYEEYQYEDYIWELIGMMIPENEEYVLNETTSSIRMERDHYIAMKKGTLPDNFYKEYGLYSPSEVNAYKERFPVCDHVFNIVYEDGSRGSQCHYGAHGEYGGKVGLNIWSSCYDCKLFKRRKEGKDVPTISDKERDHLVQKTNERFSEILEEFLKKKEK